MLGYINSEIHKVYSPLFNPKTPPETVEERKAYLAKRYKLLDERLAGRDYLFGERFTAADAYLFTVTTWAPYVKLDLSAIGEPGRLPGARRRAPRREGSDEG
jgi:glutathione S-transferase